jgi:hypothetical protein
VFGECAVGAPKPQNHIVRGEAKVRNLSQHSPKNKNPARSLHLRRIFWRREEMRQEGEGRREEGEW